MSTDWTELLQIFQKGNVNLSKLSKEKHIPKITLWRKYQQFKKRIPFEQIKPVGRPCILSPLNNVQIGRIMCRNSYATARSISQRLNGIKLDITTN